MSLSIRKQAKTVQGKVINVLLAFVAILIWMIFANSLIDELAYGQIILSDRYFFFFSCIFAPLWEELVFRKGILDTGRCGSTQNMISLMIISSAIFGWLHGYGAESIMKQGVMGLIFAWLYLKNGYSYWSTVIVHSAWNILVLGWGDIIFR
jgi:membrane protease YdiL (CAAX protease family)